MIVDLGLPTAIIPIYNQFVDANLGPSATEQPLHVFKISPKRNVKLSNPFDERKGELNPSDGSVSD